ncbi:hypothetical protein SpCBS45565_g00820 [Spizellomyces sp. 'palustris']|nr:hypothetical protein SpCBS45565_g00820 [Spizellomyces sp. 'palustris']
MVRLKNRYLLFNLHFDPSTPPSVDTAINGGTINNTLKDSLELNFGDYGIGIASFTVKYYSPHTQTGIIRCARESYQMLWAALSFITKIRNRPCIFCVVHLGGTIKSVQQVALRRDREALEMMVKKGVLDVAMVDALVKKAQDDIMALEI